jgi:addiction module HigA family antidote
MSSIALVVDGVLLTAGAQNGSAPGAVAGAAGGVVMSGDTFLGPREIMTMRTVPPVSPGEMLEEEFLKPLGLTKYRLAKDIGVPPQRIGDIVSGKRGITADTDLRLCRYFGLADGWWLRGQASYDTAIARESMGEALSRIQRCPLMAA